MDFEPPPVLESLIRPAKDMDGAAGGGGGCGIATTVTAGLVDLAAFGTLVALALSKDSWLADFALAVDLPLALIRSSVDALGFEGCAAWVLALAGCSCFFLCAQKKISTYHWVNQSTSLYFYTWTFKAWYLEGSCINSLIFWEIYWTQSCCQSELVQRVSRYKCDTRALTVGLLRYWKQVWHLGTHVYFTNYCFTF